MSAPLTEDNVFIAHCSELYAFLNIIEDMRETQSYGWASFLFRSMSCNLLFKMSSAVEMLRACKIFSLREGWEYFSPWCTFGHMYIAAYLALCTPGGTQVKVKLLGKEACSLLEGIWRFWLFLLRYTSCSMYSYFILWFHHYCAYSDLGKGKRECM